MESWSVLVNYTNKGPLCNLIVLKYLFLAADLTQPWAVRALLANQNIVKLHTELIQPKCFHFHSKKKEKQRTLEYFVRRVKEIEIKTQRLKIWFYIEFIQKIVLFFPVHPAVTWQLAAVVSIDWIPLTVDHTLVFCWNSVQDPMADILKQNFLCQNFVLIASIRWTKTIFRKCERYLQQDGSNIVEAK